MSDQPPSWRNLREGFSRGRWRHPLRIANWAIWVAGHWLGNTGFFRLLHVVAAAGIVFAALLFYWEINDRERARILRAWSVVAASPGAEGGNIGQKAAVEFLHESGECLQWINLPRTLLRHLKLQRADLSTARLYGAILEDAKLLGADLWRADLPGAFLTDARLEGARLTEARLDCLPINIGDVLCERLESGAIRCAITSKAVVQCTQLGRAHLAGADLTGANLNHAKLAGADLTRTDLTDADLRSATVTREQLLKACGDRRPKVDPTIELPDSWPRPCETQERVKALPSCEAE